MPKLTESTLKIHDERRDLAAELQSDLISLRQGVVGRVSVRAIDGHFCESTVAHARMKLKRSQAEFARLIGVSVRTVQQWEQGRREPSGAAKALIAVALHEPRALQRALAA